MDVASIATYSGVAVAALTTLYFVVTFLLSQYFEKQFKLQNLKYKNIPSQLLTIFRKGRFERIEQKKLKENNRLYGCDMFFKKTITTIEPELVQIVMNKEFTNFTNRRPFENYDPIFKHFMFVTEDDEWKRVRAILTPIFSVSKLRKLKLIIDDTASTLMKNIDRLCNQNEIVNIKQIMGSFTMDSIIQVGFGIQVDSLADPNNQIIKNARKLFSVDLPFGELVKSFLVFIAPKFSNLLNIRLNGEITDYFAKVALEIIHKKREQMKSRQNHSKCTNLIELMLEAESEMNSEGQHEDGKSFKYITNNEIIAQSVLFFLVGYDTTATTISVCSYLLALNPDKQEKLHEEIVNMLETLKQESQNGETDPFKLVTYDSLSRFEYLNAVVNETLRLSPAATATERIARKDITLETADGKIKIDVKKGDIVRVPIYSMHHDSKNFADPDEFKPERFMNPNFHKHAFIPFGSGPRNCLARNLALLESKLAILHTIRCFKLSTCSKTRIPNEYYIQIDLMVSKDIFLAVKKR